MTDRKRIRAQVHGIVQGVGFRPFVYQLAQRFDLSGFVRNTPAGVELEAEGDCSAVDAFMAAVPDEAPPLSRITGMETSPLPLGRGHGFTIQLSQPHMARNALISPDVAVCDDCLTEMFDPADRRYRYPFINCTNCGPRYTIIMDIPYDRDQTSMRDFTMCPQCAAEYHDPGQPAISRPAQRLSGLRAANQTAGRPGPPGP